jgi:hypothetical protein
MPRKKQSRGTCSYCGREMAKGGMMRHLETCPKRQETVAASAQKSGASEALYHLRVEDAWGGDFWLNLEMRGKSTLKELDRYLRAIWLECCGHMSRFSAGGWGSPDIAMSRRADQVFEPGDVFLHQYDFGTTSETLVKVVSSRQGAPTTARPIALMARNALPEAVCIACGQPASWLCMECLIEDDVFGTLCDEHVETHPHDDYGEPVPIVNSPRLGMCGYEGPADPPY